ncbi:MAG: hypothetical protein V4757_02325 [Pseudomonadota bacterium]
MKTVTIVLRDTKSANRPGVAVITDAGAPTIGEIRTPAELLAMELLRQLNVRAQSVQYGNESARLAGELVAAGAEL